MTDRVVPKANSNAGLGNLTSKRGLQEHAGEVGWIRMTAERWLISRRAASASCHHSVLQKAGRRRGNLTHYKTVNAPLVRKIPGLASFVVNRVTGTPTGNEPLFFLIAELHFADQAAFELAMSSPENQAATEDIMSFASHLVSAVVVNEDAI